ncbi:nicotinate-nicotinamide nucleotide adenylyltransferase [Enterovibrio nigricans]|uniref:nicotinate-nucleotide adenylyltransferase n=1 Tax=Enterovibrio nigricans DSM 22720 TaxID=1121868 RepID=A0A1T4V5B3_9GAMM|nr:nicotinate-nicotinamide nucleotide adenylyltransferase [Enterovibrio nigricans]PKF50402.1 nicotinate-nicotinamide nucleotide adenylyltransferase [Enterovibrio nigricans]SKA60137.1 nicotinate-nucleotide adenylyltransferase [Enterovibrio nigricans DSM 22720]
MSKQDLPQKIAIFGSAFNPPTLGHLSVIERLSHFDRVLLVPSFAHAWGKKMADFNKRCDWVSAFIQDIDCNNAELCIDEQDVYSGQSVTTWALLNHLQQKYPNAELTFVMGPDNFLNFSKFYKADSILGRWIILACPETVPVRSTLIREQLEQGKSIDTLTTVSLISMLNESDFRT